MPAQPQTSLAKTGTRSPTQRLGRQQGKETMSWCRRSASNEPRGRPLHALRDDDRAAANDLAASAQWLHWEQRMPSLHARDDAEG